MTDLPVKFRHLRTLVEVARQQSVGKAADVLHVSQPAVTKTLRELEAALGATLVEREGRGIRITRFGEVFLQHAGASLAAIQRGIDSVARARANSGPPLRIGALPTVSARIMPGALEKFLGLRTGNPVKVVSGENVVLLEQLRRGQLDLVVGRLAAPELMTGLSFAHLYDEPVVFAVRRGHPLLASRDFDFARIRDFTVVMPTQGSVIRPFVERFLIGHGIGDFPSEIETVSDSFGRAMIRTSDAIWVISEGVVAPDIESGDITVLPVDTAETRGAVGLTMRADATDPPGAALLVNCLKETVAELGL
ncbi:MAG TPA: pca operon transcription factor PcaQ [Devosiaceae bacterium]|jgi:LysR family pca operon transcriptional activator|nr:pca operon transcription factor PcaQ [Devosiaceae bacterium]